MSGRAPSGPSEKMIEAVGGATGYRLLCKNFGIKKINSDKRNEKFPFDGKKSKLFNGTVTVDSGYPFLIDVCYFAPSKSNISKMFEQGWSQASALASYLLMMYQTDTFPHRIILGKRTGNIKDAETISTETIRVALIWAMHFADIGSDIVLPDISLQIDSKWYKVAGGKYSYSNAMSMTGLKVADVPFDDILLAGGGKIPEYWQRHEMIEYVTEKYLSEGTIWHLSKSEIANNWTFFAQIIGDNQMPFMGMLSPAKEFPPTPDMYPAVCSGNGVNIRDTASKSGKVVGTAKKGDKLFQLEYADGASFVSVYHVPTGKYGYISVDFVNKVEESATIDTPESSDSSYSDTGSSFTETPDTTPEPGSQENPISPKWEPPAENKQADGDKDEEDEKDKDKDKTLIIAAAAVGVAAIGGALWFLNKKKFEIQ